MKSDIHVFSAMQQGIIPSVDILTKNHMLASGRIKRATEVLLFELTNQVVKAATKTNKTEGYKKREHTAKFGLPCSVAVMDVFNVCSPIIVPRTRGATRRGCYNFFKMVMEAESASKVLLQEKDKSPFITNVPIWVSMLCALVSVAYEPSTQAVKERSQVVNPIVEMEVEVVGEWENTKQDGKKGKDIVWKEGKPPYNYYENCEPKFTIPRKYFSSRQYYKERMTLAELTCLVFYNVDVTSISDDQVDYVEDEILLQPWWKRVEGIVSQIGLRGFVNSLLVKPSENCPKLFQKDRSMWFTRDKIPQRDEILQEIVHSSCGRGSRYNFWEKELMKQGKLTPEDDQDENNDEAWPGCWGKYHPECPFAVSLIEDPNEEWEEERDGEKERKAKEVEFETNYRVSLKKYTQDESLVTYCEEDRGRHLNNVLGILTGKKKSPHTYVLKKEFLESFVWEGCRRAFLGAFAVLNTDVSKYLGEDGEKASREYTKALQQAYSQLNQKNSRSYLVGQDTGGINIRFNYAIGNLSTAVIKHSEDVAGRGKKVRGKDQDYGWQKCYTHGDIELLGVSTWQNKLALLQEGNSREGFQDDARSKEEELRGLVPKFSVQDTAIGVASSTSSADPIHILKQVMFLLQNQALNENRANGKADPIARANLLLGDISKLILKRVRVEGEKITIFGRKKSPPAPPGPQQDGPQQHPPQQDGPQQDPPQQDPPQQDRPQSPDEPPPPDVDYATEDMFSPASMSSLPEVAQMDETVGGGDGIGNLSSAARLLQQEIFTPVNQSGAQEQWTPEQRTENTTAG